MLNWAARYFPILKVLKQAEPKFRSVLEIGSGPVGMGMFYRAPFVGCDVTFASSPKAPMRAVVATALGLPFGDRSFEAVVVSDVLEHVPPTQRLDVIREALRVTGKVAIFGFPCGQRAFEYDRKLAELYDRKQRTRPMWLEEHMQHPFPTEDLFRELRGQCQVTSFGNESLAFHAWVMRREMSAPWNRLFSGALSVLPGMFEWFLGWADREPYYRKIVVVRP